MDFLKLLEDRGYKLRQHLEEESWALFKPKVVDLDAVQSNALKKQGVAGLKKTLVQTPYRPRGSAWTFPALDISAPLPRRPDTLLAEGSRPRAVVILPGKDEELRKTAFEFAREVEKRYKLKLPVQEDCEAGLELIEKNHLALFGGSHQNSLALELALRFRTLFMDASVPGKGGCAVTTHCGLTHNGGNIVQACADSRSSSGVLETMFKNIEDAGGQLVLKHVHEIQPSTLTMKNTPSWKKFAEGALDRIIQFAGKRPEAPEAAEDVADLLAEGFDSGGAEKGYYNSAPIDIANDCAAYYRVSADKRALRLFRELLFRLADYYLKKPGGACYPSDLDFRLGMLILNFSRLEHTPVFSDEDRLLLVNLLLSCARSVSEYASRMWPPEKKGNSARHNHQTFPALSLLYASDYFGRFGLAEAEDWKNYAEKVFHPGLYHRSKQVENARLYETFVFTHEAAYSAFTGRGLSLLDLKCYEEMVMRQVIATDNFFRPVDYGDTRISIEPEDSVSARFLAILGVGIGKWFAGEGLRRSPSCLPGSMISSLLHFPGTRLPPDAGPPESGRWESLPLSAVFLEENSPGFPPESAFDKAAFRTGWSVDDHYLLLEGVKGGISHAHNESNGIVRLNHLGRHWIVSNGYGKKAQVTNAAEAFGTRQLGPEDHNMLVLQRGGHTVKKTPMCALLQLGAQDGLLFYTGALLSYGGTNWFRTLVVCPGKYVLALDRIEVLDPGVEKAWVEWNCLGYVKTGKSGFRLTQDGVFFDLTSESGWQAEHNRAADSACWKKVLEEGSYPHASFPLAKIVFHSPRPEPGRIFCLAALLAASKLEQEFFITQPEINRVLIRGPHPFPGKFRISDRDLSISASESSCEIRFSGTPDIPPPLQKWQFRAQEESA